MNDSRIRKKLTVAIPVYNGENYLTQAIESHLAQTFTDYELILSDNASTDGTRDICESYAKKDDRIRYIRHEKNLGAAINFTSAFDISGTEYFKWSAHDDILSPKFIQSAVEKLDTDPSVVLCTGEEIAIDKNGEVIEGYMNKYGALNNLESGSAHRRFQDFACRRHACYRVFGVARSAALRGTPRLVDYIGADRVLLAELSLHGRIWESPEPIYFRRHSEQYCALEDNNARKSWWNTDGDDEKIFVHSRNFKEYMAAIKRTRLGFSETLLCNVVMMKWLVRKRRYLLRELVIAFK